MNWALFWFAAACFVLTLIVLQNWERLRAWFSLASTKTSASVIEFGRKVSDVTGIGATVTGIGRKAGKVTGSAISIFGAAGTRLAGLPWVRLAAIPLLLGLIWGVVAYIEGRGADRERIKQAREDVAVADHETNIANRATELAEETHQDRERVRTVIARAEEEIADAVSQADFDRLHDAYSRAYQLVWASGVSEDRPDPIAPGAEGVHRAPGHTA